MRGVIIAAGAGSRFGELTKTRPKPLLKVKDRFLIQWVMSSLILGGVDDIFIVVGYLGKKIKKYLRNNYHGVDISFVENPIWEKGNLTSLYAVREHIKGEFILSMSDHLFDPSIIRDIISYNSSATVLLAADRKYQQTDDDMKVLVENYHIKNTGKNIIGNYVDIGLFKMKDKVFDYTEMEIEDGHYQLYYVVLRAANFKDALIMDINRRFWIDVDTPEELNSYYVQRFPYFLKNGRWD